jgi:hypothetical protein
MSFLRNASFVFIAGLAAGCSDGRLTEEGAVLLGAGLTSVFSQPAGNEQAQSSQAGQTVPADFTGTVIERKPSKYCEDGELVTDAGQQTDYLDGQAVGGISGISTEQSALCVGRPDGAKPRPAGML